MSLRERRMHALSVGLDLAKLALERHGWTKVGRDHWRREAGASATHLAADPEKARGWQVTVETGGEVMNLPFRARSFGAAVTQANRLYNLAHASEEQAEASRQRRLAEHYGIERMEDYP